jgi:hypothetical protein
MLFDSRSWADAVGRVVQVEAVLFLQFVLVMFVVGMLSRRRKRRATA